MRETLFLTGGSGTVGRAIVSLIFQNTDFTVSLLLHERGNLLSKETLIRDLLGVSEAERFCNRLQLVIGDVTKPQLGMTKDDYQRTIKSVGYILHGAASTRFDLPMDKAREINVIGLENTFALARDCDRLERFGFISTVYVSGKRLGTIGENELGHTAGFANTYEQSKYEAELLLKELQGLPLAVYRLSTIIGDDKTGKVTHFTAPHQALRIMHLGLASMLPGTPGYPVDLISSQYTAQTIFNLYFNAFKPKQTFHITSGKPPLTLQEIIDESYRFLAEADKEWADRRYPQPAIVSGEAFDLFMESAQAANNPLLRAVLSALSHFAHQLLYPKTFDNRNLLAAIPSYNAKSPDIREYYGKIVNYCVRTNWGKR